MGSLSDSTVQLLSITGKDVLETLKRCSAGKAAGTDGMRWEHMWMCLGESAAEQHADPDAFSEGSSRNPFADTTAKIFTVLVSEPQLLPEQCWRLLRSGSLSAIGVKCRPIAVTSVWRRLLSSITARQISEKLAPVLTGMKHFGVGMPAGVEHTAMEARLWHSLYGTTVQLDCVNAVNSVDRAAVLQAIQRFCPELLPYFTAVYCGETLPEMRAEMREADGAQADLVYLILSELGCQQGDPLGPLLFALAPVHVLNPVSADGAVDESGSPATFSLAPAGTLSA